MSEGIALVNGRAARTCIGDILCMLLTGTVNESWMGYDFGGHYRFDGAVHDGGDDAQRARRRSAENFDCRLCSVSSGRQQRYPGRSQSQPAG